MQEKLFIKSCIQNRLLFIRPPTAKQLTDRTSLTKHNKNIYKTEELDEASTCAKFAQVQTEGTRTIKREINHYNLDLTISVGYRVNSKRGIQFRIWANKVLKEYLVKGYAVNEKRLKEQSEQ